MVAEQVNRPARLAAGGRPDHLDVVALPGAQRRQKVRRGTGVEGSEVGGGDGEARVSPHGQAEGGDQGGPVPVVVLGRPVVGGGARQGRERPTADVYRSTLAAGRFFRT
jgi:hypothetical protein